MTFEEFKKTFHTTLYSDGFYAEDLAIIASCLYKNARNVESWHDIVTVLEHLTEPKKREGICIAIIESAIEEPVEFGWFEILPVILANEKLYWVLERGYRYCNISLYQHIKHLVNG
jgi:hypothetical protein